MEFEAALTGARSGDERAWTHLYDWLAPSVLGFCRARGADDPEDVMGEVFLQVVRDIGRFTGTESDFRSWVFTIAYHRLMDDFRKRKRRPSTVGEEVLAVRAGGDVAEEALQRMSDEEIKRAISSLTIDQRDVLLLRIVAELGVSEIAGILGKRPGAVQALQRRGLEALRKEISPEGVSFRPRDALT